VDGLLTKVMFLQNKLFIVEFHMLCTSLLWEDSYYTLHWHCNTNHCYKDSRDL